MQILAISDSIENTRYDVKRKAMTFKAYNATPVFAIPEFVTNDSCEKTDVSECLDYCFTECPPECIAISLVRDPDNIKLIADKLASYDHSTVISEISLISGSGDVLVSADTYNAIMQYLIPHVQFLSLNIYEAELLSQQRCTNSREIEESARMIANQYNVIVFICGSDRSEWKELLYFGSKAVWMDPQDTVRDYKPDRSLLISIACELASDKSIVDAVKCARRFVSGRAQEVKKEIVPAPKTEAHPRKPAVSPAMYKQPQFSFTARAAQRRAELEKHDTEEKAKTEPAPVQSLVSPAKSLRDIARNIESAEATGEAKPAVTSVIEEPAPGPKGTVSEIKEREIRSSADSISELSAMLERMKKLSES